MGDTTVQLVGAAVAILILKEVFAFILPLLKKDESAYRASRVVDMLGEIRDEIRDSRTETRKLYESLYIIVIDLMKRDRGPK
jgi:hypothetical protein